MSSVLLVYPFFLESAERSRFRFPPLGVAYLASSLQRAGHTVHILDCTFRRRQEALAEALALDCDVIGIYCMVTLEDDCLWFARSLRRRCRHLVAGGPLPSCEPERFVDDFDVVVVGEGEVTFPELIRALESGIDLGRIAGIAYRVLAESSGEAPRVVSTPPRIPDGDLDAIPLPARELLPNRDYIDYGRRHYGFSITTVMSSRGCPYRCDFCSNIVFGGSYRERSPENVVDEVEQALALGYERISFADDVFTLRPRRTVAVCRELRARCPSLAWECLARVDTMSPEIAGEMRSAGCRRVFFGIESGSDAVLELMDKRITVLEARRAVECARGAGLEVGAFFILCYPGETDETVLATLRFAASLPLDYLGLTFPYPLPGTPLYERVKHRLRRPWRSAGGPLFGHVLTYESEFSPVKMDFALLKGRVEFEIRRRCGRAAPHVLRLFGRPTDWIFSRLR